MKEASWISYAHWVQDTLKLMRGGTPGKVGLFESSVPEPSAMLADTISASFRNGPPASYQSVFMRDNPDLVRQLSQRYGVSVDHIRCVTGATSAIQHIYAAVLQKGDLVLVERPGFDIFANNALDAGMEVGFFDRQGPDFDLSVDAVLEQLEDRTRMVVISNLHNPSGALASDEQLESLASALAEHGVYLLIDEVYRDYHAAEPCQFDVTAHPNVVRVGSMTKMFGMSTLRCGWMFASGRLMEALRAHCDRVDFSVSKLSHAVAAEVFSRADIFDGWREGHMETAIPVAEACLRGMVDTGLIELALPLRGCTCFPRITGVEDTVALSRWLISRCGVVVVPGECFGMAGHIRIGYAQDETQLRTGLERLANGLNEYREHGSKSQRIA